jgi:nucleoside-diphosphate-sugar epimerase
MRVLVTGAAGFVGRYVVTRLARDHEVVALVHAQPSWDVPVAKTIVADLTSPSMGARLPRDIDVVIHLAQAYKTFPEHAAEIFAVNATSTQRLADHARSVGVRRFVLASSGSIYRPGPEPLRETDPPRPMGFHPATKLIAEQVLSYYADPLEVVSLRLFAPFGPGQVDRLIPRLIESVRSGSSIALSRGGEPRLNPIYIDDLAEVFAQAVAGAGAGVINIGGPTVVSIRDIAEAAGEALGRAPIFETRDREPYGDLVADTTAMHRHFELPAMVEPRDGIRRMVVEAPALA